MDPGATPNRPENFLISSVLSIPLGQSQRTCRATVGQTPVKRCTCPASLNFSSVVVAAAACMNFPNRVPVLAKPQDGSSMRNVSSAAKTLSLVLACMRTSFRDRRLHVLNHSGHGFLWRSCQFRNAKHSSPVRGG